MKRVLVVLPNWVGETLFATPFLRALKARWPAAQVTTLGPPVCREVLLHNPDVDERLDYEERGRHRSWLGTWTLVRELRRRRFDAAVILRRSLSRSLLLVLAGIPIRIGFANPKSGWVLTHRVIPSAVPRHKAFGYLQLFNAFGGEEPKPQPSRYAVSEEERREAVRWLEAEGLREPTLVPFQLVDAHGPSGVAPYGGRETARLPSARRVGTALVLLHPGANWPHKRWPAERFAQLGDRLVAQRAVRVLISGGPGDREVAQAVAGRMRAAAFLMEPMGLRRLGALLEQVQLVVSNDTGVLHLAAALQRPLVALYGPTSPALTGPLGAPERMVLLHHAGCCPRIPCYEPEAYPHPGMEAITVDEAYDAALRLLEVGSQKSEV